jgi:hypothetical protein
MTLLDKLANFSPEVRSYVARTHAIKMPFTLADDLNNATPRRGRELDGSLVRAPYRDVILFDDAEVYCITSGRLARQIILPEIADPYRDSKLAQADIATAIAGLIFMEAPDRQRTLFLIGSVCLFITPANVIMVSPGRTDAVNQ